MITVFGGAFQNSHGAPLASGTIQFSLSADSQYSDGYIAAGVPAVFTLDSNGNLPNTLIWSNAELNSVGQNYYIVTLYDSNETEVLRSPLKWIFTNLSGDTQDLGQMSSSFPVPII